jgi:stage V sporulation protein S
MNETSATQPTEETILKVGGGSNPQSTASAIAHAVYEHRQVKLRAVGASAVNQAVKAIAIARGYVAPRGLDLTCKPGFTTIESHDGEISAIIFAVTAQ